MKNGMCIAGVNLDNFKNIRPVLFSGHIQMPFIEKNNIFPCAICTFEGMPKINASPPHTEDFSVNDNVVFRRFISQSEWFDILRHCSSKSLPERLNSSIREDKWITPGTDVPSLSLIEPEGRPAISSITNGTSPDIRASFISGGREFCLKVNDKQLTDYLSNRLRLPPINSIAEKQFISEINDELFSKDTYNYVRIGLTRPYQERCWLQINGMYSGRSDVMIRKLTPEKNPTL